jgi:hypothetical protein
MHFTLAIATLLITAVSAGDYKTPFILIEDDNYGGKSHFEEEVNDNKCRS